MRGTNYVLENHNNFTIPYEPLYISLYVKKHSLKHLMFNYIKYTHVYTYILFNI